MKKLQSVLLIDDDFASNYLTRTIIQDMDITETIHTTTNGEEALHFLFATGPYAGRDMQNIPKVILLDIKMPKVDGIEVLRRLKATEATKLIPVVIMTSSKEEQDIVRSYELGVNSFVVKPVLFQDFAKAVSELGMYWVLINQPPR